MPKNIYKELAKEGFLVKNKKKKKKGKSKFLKVLFYLFILALVLAIAGALWLLNLYKTLPEPESFGERVISQSTKIYDRTEENLLYEIHGEEKRTVIPLNQIPDLAQKAVIAIEDAEFYNHPAFDWRAIMRAAIKNVTSGRIAQGGSTITQQLAKNIFLSSEKKIIRKIKELILAIKLEQNYSKDEILEFYLNQVPFGSNAYGIEAASKTFFGKSSSDLTLAEASLLAALPQAPSYFSPYGSHQKDLFIRQGFVLNKMKELGFIDEQQLVAAKKEELKFQPQATGIKAPHFVMYIKEYIENKYGSKYIETAGLKIVTTLDMEMQQMAEEAVAEGAQRNEELYGGKNAALIAQDPKTGQILAMVGSRDYFDIENEGNFNVITSHRQPGSSFKPFAYLAAFEKGYLPSTIVFDLETDFDTTKVPGKSYIPKNYDHKFRGPVDLRHALAQSMNVPAVKTVYLAGINNTIKLANKFGLTTLSEDGHYGLSLVLGGGDVRPIEMATAYSIFAQDGIKHKQQTILKIEDSKGKILEEYVDETEEVFDSKYIRMLNDVLSDNEARVGLFSRDNRLVIDGHQVAAKTGTTQDYRDAWIFGYTPSLVAGVWAGNNDFSPMHEGGGSIMASVPIWNSFMVKALAKYPTEFFPTPQYETANKPILNGEFLSHYKVKGQLYPQIHNILYWLDKNDPLGPIPETRLNEPQFENWEEPVLEWIKESNLPNIENINQPLPSEDKELIVPQKDSKIVFLSPAKGSFLVENQKVKIQASVNDPSGIKTLKIYFNNQMISQTLDFKGNEFSFEFIPSQIESQNEIKIEIENNLGQTFSEKIIVFK